MGVRKVSNSKNDLYGHSRTLVEHIRVPICLP